MGSEASSKSNVKSMMKKAIFTLFLISTLTISVGFAKETAVEESAVYNKIYHVYDEQQYIGYVSDEQLVKSIIKEKSEEVTASFSNLQVRVGENISIIPEQIFNVQLKDEETLNKLREVIDVETVAYALKVDGQVVAYLRDQQSYNEVLNRLKLQYVSQKELDVLANRPALNTLPELQENETRILEVSLMQDVVGEETVIAPTEVKTVDEVFNLLKNGSLKQEVYKVQQGDVLGAIAKKHNLTTAQLLELNKDVTLTSVLRIGQELNVTVLKPLVTVKVVKESVKPQVVQYKQVTEQDSTMLKGESKLTQKGTDGKKTVSSVTTIVNGTQTATEVKKEVIVKEVVDEVTKVGTKVIPSRGTGSFVWPTNGGYISSYMGPRWGSYHRGIDIARPSDYTIKAIDNGVVTAAGWDGSYGYRIIINHNNGFVSLYAHLSKINVKVGQVVAQGSAIGVMGSTGNSTGTHLHLELEKNGVLVNPLSYLK